jgi:hypothetical protein
MQFTNNSILSRHYLEYLKTLNLNGELLSQNLNDKEIKTLYNREYKLTEFNIYKYITAHDYIIESLGCYKYNLTEGINYDKNKYKNKYKYFLFVKEKLNINIKIKFPICIGKLKFKLIKINYLKVQKLCRYSYMFVKINKI